MDAFPTYLGIIKERGLRDTETRRHVLATLLDFKRPLSPQELWSHLRSKTGMDLVTVYRILDRFHKIDLVHAHADGTYSLCTSAHEPGHHGFLRCTSCGTTEEFHDDALCRMEDAIAKRRGFHPITHASEILGICTRCFSKRHS